MLSHLTLLQSGLSPGLINGGMFALLLVIFYFFLIRPQNQRQKQQVAFQDAIKKGDKVITGSGILGRVSKVDKEEGTVTLEVGKNNYIEMTLGSVSRELTEGKYGSAKG